MLEEINLPFCADFLKSINNYQNLYYGFTQIDYKQTDKLKEFFNRKNLKNITKNNWNNPNIYSVSQGWANTSCGWEGIGGAAMSWAYTVVIENNLAEFIAVYYKGVLAYIAEIDENLEKFKSKNYQNLPGIKSCQNLLTAIYINKR